MNEVLKQRNETPKAMAERYLPRLEQISKILREMHLDVIEENISLEAFSEKIRTSREHGFGVAFSIVGDDRDGIQITINQTRGMTVTFTGNFEDFDKFHHVKLRLERAHVLRELTHA